jgi:hypothetical protein
MSDFSGIFNFPDVIFSSSEGTQVNVKIGSRVFGFAVERKGSLKAIMFLLFFMRLGSRNRFCVLDGLGVESRWGRDFPVPVQTALGPSYPPVQWIAGIKRPERSAYHSPTSSTSLRMGLSLPSLPALACLGVG